MKEEEEEEFGYIISEVKVQIALGTMSDTKADKIIAFLAENSTDQRELTEIFWLLVDHGYNRRFPTVYTKFVSNDYVCSTLKKYVLPLASNRPLPDYIEENYPRWTKKNSESK